MAAHLLLTEVSVVRLSERVNGAIMAVFCILLQDDRDDATVGRWQLSKLLATFLASMMTTGVCEVRYSCQSNLQYTTYIFGKRKIVAIIK